MPASPDLLIQIADRHQVHLNKMYSGVANQYAPFLKEIAKTVKSQLSGDITQWKRARLEKQLRSLNKDILLIQDDYIEEVFIPSSLTLGQSEAKFEIKSLEQVVKYDFTLPTEGQLKSAVMINPLNVTGPDGGKLLFTYIKDTTRGTTNLIINNIRLGAYSGLTTPQIIRNIVGTKAANFKDGKLYNVNRDVGTMVRTGLAHVSAQARTETWERNSDIMAGFRISVTFDGKTCFDGDSKIILANNEIKKIKNIIVGDRLKSETGHTNVIATLKHKNKKVIKVTFNNGKVITCTPEHEFLTNNGWKEAYLLTDNDIIKEVG